MSKGLVLIIDDEKDLVDLVRYNLEKDGYHVISAGDGESGLALAIERKPDLAVVDLMLPGIDGLETCRLLRQSEATAMIPIIMLTAKSSESDRIVGLEIGADDYVTKPFSPRELLARVKAILRRSSGYRPTPAVIRRGKLAIDTTSLEVSCNHTRIDLTATEYRLLRFLATHPGFVYSRSALIDGALGRDVTVLERTIDVHIMSLRKKLGKCGEWIETIRGFGYRFREEYVDQ
ncbi:MAG TPA: response regulator [Acidobacteriota bacterium]|nr:response regulator [Acidobacteriota bacterium]